MALLGPPPPLPPPEPATFHRFAQLAPKLLKQPSRTLLVALLLAVLGLGAAQGQSDASKEYQIKAAFLYNFVQFVKWPSDSFGSANAPFCIGVLGDDPFDGALEAIVRGENIDSHRLMVEHASRYEDLQDCQMIFVCRSEEDHLPEILSQIGSRPVLTVSEIDSFARNGGDIDFYLEGSKVRFEINPSSARRSGLKISSQLLNLGRIVEP
jgi:hypothetical protein